MDTSTRRLHASYSTPLHTVTRHARHAREAVTSRTAHPAYSRRCERYRIDRSRENKYTHASRRRHARRARGTRAHDADDDARARGDAVASDDESDDEKNGRDATRRGAMTTTTRAVRDGDGHDGGRAPVGDEGADGTRGGRARGEAARGGGAVRVKFVRGIVGRGGGGRRRVGVDTGG